MLIKFTTKEIIQKLFEKEEYPSYHIVPHDNAPFDNIDSWNKRANYRSNVGADEYESIIRKFLFNKSVENEYKDFKYQTGWTRLKGEHTWVRSNFEVIE